MDVSRQIADLAGPAAQTAGLVVDSVEIHPAGKNTRVVITVDLPPDAIGSADMDDVAAAARAISEVLDEADIPKSEHTLEVSTPGIGRPLTKPHHFARARTRLVSIVRHDGGTAEGYLTAVEDGILTLEPVKGEALTVPLKDVARGAIEIDMKRKK